MSSNMKPKMTLTQVTAGRLDNLADMIEDSPKVNGPRVVKALRSIVQDLWTERYFVVEKIQETEQRQVENLMLSNITQIAERMIKRKANAPNFSADSKKDARKIKGLIETYVDDIRDNIGKGGK